MTIDANDLFNIAGDGETDDTDNLQKAFTALAESHTTGTLRPGHYLISDTLTYNSNLSIVGPGQGAAVIANTLTRTGTLMLQPAAPAVHNTRLAGLTIDQRGDHYDGPGGVVDQPCISVDATHDLTLTDITLRNTRTMAIWADSTPTNPTLNLTVRGCRILRGGGGGISLFGQIVDTVIEDNELWWLEDDAIALQATTTATSNGQPTRARIQRNRIRRCTVQTSYGATPRGILAYGATSVDVFNNDIDGTYGNGIQVCDGGDRRSTHIHLRQNRQRGAGDGRASNATPAFGLFLLNSDHITDAGNDLSRNLDGNRYDTGCTDIVSTAA